MLIETKGLDALKITKISLKTRLNKKLSPRFYGM